MNRVSRRVTAKHQAQIRLFETLGVGANLIQESKWKFRLRTDSAAKNWKSPHDSCQDEPVLKS
jgi:hypothetical protein